ncbi:MAG: hypothetical protein JXB85_10390 [Anaerolineales bacterium]|nr:hypothetical protein [Anaerolineales bacterium]
MEEFASPSLQRHRRQRFWQVLLPIILFLVGMLALGVLVIFATFEAGALNRLWADISLIWLLFPMLVFALLVLAVLAALIYAIGRLTQATPRLTSKVQALGRQVEQGTRQVADQAVQPVMRFKQIGAVLQSFFKRP